MNMPTKILFVCAANAQRSPTFANYFEENMKDYAIASAGIYHGYPNQVNEEILDWADKIFVMDISQEMFIARRYPEFLNKVEIIGVSDQYSRDSPELKEIIRYWIKKRGL